MRKNLIKILFTSIMVINLTSCQEESATPEPTYCLPETYTFKVVYNNQNTLYTDVSFNFDGSDKIQKYTAKTAIYNNDILNSIDVTLDQEAKLIQENFGVITNGENKIEYLRTFETISDTTIIALMGAQFEGDTTSFFILEMTTYLLDENKYPKEIFLFQTDITQSETAGQYVFTPYSKQIHNWTNGNLLSIDFLRNEDDLIVGDNSRNNLQENYLPNIPIHTLKNHSLESPSKEKISILRADEDGMVSIVYREFLYDANPSSMQYATPLIFSTMAIYSPTFIVSKNNITGVKELNDQGVALTLSGTSSKNNLGYGTGTTFSYNGQSIYELSTQLLCK